MRLLAFDGEDAACLSLFLNTIGFVLLIVLTMTVRRIARDLEIITAKIAPPRLPAKRAGDPAAVLADMGKARSQEEKDPPFPPPKE